MIRIRKVFRYIAGFPWRLGILSYIISAKPKYIEEKRIMTIEANA